MKKNVLLLLMFVLPIFLFAQMSDNQIIDYVKTEYAKGKSQQEIGVALLQRGVSQEQLERIKRQLENQPSTVSTNRNSSEGTRIRQSNIPLRTDTLQYHSDGKNIFGKNIFSQKNLTFAPSVNIATPENYKLGAGDEVIIDIWGASQTTIQEIISPDGTITVNNIGPLSLSGMTVEEANKYVRNKFSALYSGLNDPYESTKIKLTIGQIRTIQVNVMGEVWAPGSYSVSSLSSIFHALYIAGGVNDIGSLREINLYRKGQRIASFDIYRFLHRGESPEDIRLYDGDIIIVPPYKSLVNITGEVKRPMFYEMDEKETLKDLIDYAGGFSAKGNKEQINITRATGKYDQVFTISENEYSSFILLNGDSIIVEGNLNLFENRVQITGAVFRPGYYEVGDHIKSVRDLISKAGGLKEDAFWDRAVLTRENPDLTLSTISLNLHEIISDGTQDITLQKNDILYIASQKIEQDLGDVKIDGMVVNPGTFKFAKNTTIKDIIIKAGGILNSASTVKIDVSRRIVDPTSTTEPEVIAKTFTFSVENGLLADGKEDFFLEPYDQIYIRKSPGYQTQRNISVNGEVMFPGTYTLELKEQRLSDIIKNSGGLTKYAFAEGAKLLRERTKEEQEKYLQSMKLLMKGSSDSISTDLIDTSRFYSVGIELDLAIKKPKSEFDLVLKEGDQLFIPEFDNTVKINGGVMFPNTVLFKKGKSLKYYIEQAGGFNDLAMKKNVYIVYMNGTTAKAKGSSKDLLRPGCEIIVPTKERKDRMSIGEKIAIGSSITSMASIIALLINSLTK